MGWEARLLPVVTTTSIYPSVTLRCYLEESSPGSVAMATLLTKSSLRGGGWLTQELRGLGEDVHSEGFIRRACLPTPAKAAHWMGPSADLVCP